jgi:hypothetical protein
MPVAADPSGSDSDPHGFAEALGRIGIMSRRGSKPSVAVVAAILNDGETVHELVIGRVYAHPGIAVLTNQRLLLANEREYKPDLVEIAVAPPLTVSGMQDDRAASLVFGAGDFSVVIDSIRDKELAQQMASTVRQRVG